MTASDAGAPFTFDDGSGDCDPGDLSFHWGYVPDYYGYGSFLSFFDEAAGIPATISIPVELDEITGELRYGWGYMDTYAVGGGPFFYTAYGMGQAILDPPAPVPHVPNTYAYTSLEGEQHFEYNLSPDPDLQCDLRWVVTGTAEPTMCDGCDFAFEVEYDYDVSSLNDGTCTGWGFDYSAYWAYTEDYRGMGPYLLYGTDKDWMVPLIPGSFFNPTTGALSFGQGLQDSTHPSYPGYYYTSYMSLQLMID